MNTQPASAKRKNVRRKIRCNISFFQLPLPPRAILAAGVLLNVSQKHAGAVKSEVSAMPGPELPGPELSVCEIAGTLKPLQDTAAQGDIRPMSSVELKMGERGGGIFFGQFLDHC